MSSIAWPRPTSTAAVPRAPRSSASSTTAGSSVTRSPAVVARRARRAGPDRRSSTGVEVDRAAARRARGRAPARSSSVGVGRAGHERAAQVGGDHAARRAEQRRRHHRRLHDRVREGDPARLLEDRHEEATRRAPGRRRPRARGATSTPIASRLSHTPRSSSPARRVPRGAHHRRRGLLGQQVAHRVAERDLVVRQREPHGRLQQLSRREAPASPRPSCGGRSGATPGACDHRGSPRTRSAAMLRWISLVPA